MDGLVLFFRVTETVYGYLSPYICAPSRLTIMGREGSVLDKKGRSN